MIRIYHNPRCRKSREGLALLEAKNIQFEVVKYLETPLNKEELTGLLQKLQIKPIQLIRKNEAIWKEKFKGKALSDDEIIKAMVNYPKLIERPIVTNQDKAVVARPAEKINLIVE